MGEGESYLYANYIITLPPIKLINNRYVGRESSCPVTAIAGESPASISARADLLLLMSEFVHGETKARKPVDNTHYLIQCPPTHHTATVIS
jgi:hypothetical protein